MMHQIGQTEFLKELVQAMYNASQEMEDIDTASSDNYRCTATSIQDLIDLVEKEKI
jgi:hypothetical protein